MLSLLAENTALFLTTVFVITISSSALGTGTGLFLLPIAILRYGAPEGIGIITIYYICQNVNKILFFRKHVQTKVGLYIGLFSIPGSIIGAYALAIVDPELFKKAFATVFLLYLAKDTFFKETKMFSEKHLLPVFGFFYGLLSGLLGTGIVVKGPTLRSLGLLKESYIGTYAFTSFINNIPKIITYSLTGVVTVTSYIEALPLLALSIIGTAIGKRCNALIHPRVFKVLLNVSFATIAFAMLFG